MRDYQPGKDYYLACSAFISIVFYDSIQFTKRGPLCSVALQSSDLPINFNFSNVAHFKAVPISGKLSPLQTLPISIMFQPRNLGRFSGTMHVELTEAVLEAERVSLTVQGSATTVTAKLV